MRRSSLVAGRRPCPVPAALSLVLAAILAGCGPADPGTPGAGDQAPAAGTPAADAGGPGGRDAREGAGGATGEGAARGDSLREEVVAELEAYYVDFSARDWDAFSDHFWPGATITTVWRPPGEASGRVVVTPVPDFVDRAPEGPGSREVFEEEMTGVEVRVTGELAQAWARYSARFGDPGDVAEWEGTDAFTLMKHGGRWRIVSLAYAGDG